MKQLLKLKTGKISKGYIQVLLKQFIKNYLNMKTNLKKYIILSSIFLTITACLYGGWSAKEWVNNRDANLIQSGYDKAMAEVKLQNK